MTTRYCGPGGNDGNSGLTWALRKLTLNGVEDTPVVAGDVCYIAPGVYREQLTVDVSGGNAYVVGTVDVTKGSKQVDGNGTAWLANVAADYSLHIATYASGNDGVANGTATFTSAAGNFQAAMIGQYIGIDTKGAYKINAVAAANSITLSDPQGIGWPGAGAGLAYSVMSGEGPYDIDSVDDNTTIQLKQPWNGLTLTAIAYITYNPIRYIGDVAGGHTDGVGGIVRVTGSDNDQTAARAYCVSNVGGNDYRVFRGFMFDTATSYLLYNSNNNHLVIEDCSFQNGVNKQLIDVRGVGQSNVTIRRCVFLFSRNSHIYISHSAAIDNTGHLVENCILLSGRMDSVTLARVGDLTIKNCIFLGGGDDHIDVTISQNNGHPVNAYNCVFVTGWNSALEAAGLGDIVEDFNTFYGNVADRTNVAIGANSETYPPLLLSPLLHAGAGQISGFRFPWTFGALSEWSQLRALTGINEPAADLFGITRPVTASKNSWGPIQFQDMERETGTTRGASTASLCLHDAGRHQIFVPVANESTTISVYVYREANYAGNNPQMIVKQPGQADDITTDAAAASQWNLLTTTLTPAADPPYVVVELVSRNTNGANDKVFFDDLVVS